MNITEVSRKLRRNMTNAEKVFWEYVRGRRLDNYKIVRQHPLIFNFEGRTRFFVADFFCKQRKLIIEIDGGIHNTRGQKERDTYRESLCSQLGYTTIRFSNEMVLQEKKITLKTLKQKLQELSRPKTCSTKKLTSKLLEKVMRQ
jgi:leucyl-tRNA synthetase